MRVCFFLFFFFFLLFVCFFCLFFFALISILKIKIVPILTRDNAGTLTHLVPRNSGNKSIGM